MEKGELRIGNYYNSVKFGVAVLCDISDLSDLCHRADGAIDHPPIEEMYEPIPLTEQWLKWFGFKDFKTDYGIMLNTPDKHLIIMPFRNEFYPCIEVEAEFASGEKQVCHLERIEYLHELQNLYYALTKRELVLAVVPK